ncbi:hypothetical protein BLOT_008823 [Blomia tropicalis]|nr:hypothetical protein BLOT_008823 [Blomia tropicalis]
MNMLNGTRNYYFFMPINEFIIRMHVSYTKLIDTTDAKQKLFVQCNLIFSKCIYVDGIVDASRSPLRTLGGFRSVHILHNVTLFISEIEFCCHFRPQE